MPENEKTNEQPTTTTGAAPVNSGSNGGQHEEDASKAVQERIARAKRKEAERILKALGFDDLDKAKETVDKAKQITDGQSSESQKLQKMIEKLTTDLEAERTRTAKAEADRRAYLIHSAIKEAASEGPSKAEHVADVINFIQLSGADLAALISEDGKVDAAKVKTLVDGVRTARPTWFKGGGVGSPSNRNGRAPEPGADLKAKAAAEFKRQIKRMT